MSHEAALSGKKITILGAGVSGLALARLASRLGADVFLSEAKDISTETAEMLKSEGIAFEMGGHSQKTLDCDQAVVGSGFPPTAEVVAMLKEHGVPLIGELDFVGPFLHGRLVAVTGSNGKTTTTSLVGHLLESTGARVATVGNIGKPIADIACVEYDYIVVELSSFQLYWSNELSLDMAIVTNIAPDHIDWHGSFENYVEAKARLLSFVVDGGFSIVQERDMGILEARKEKAFALAWGEAAYPNAIVLDNETKSAKLYRKETEEGEKKEIRLFGFADTRLLGNHNMENVAMAMAALHLLGIDPLSALSALGTYTPPPHRCALVAEIEGVSYVDDSKGTNVAATVTALASLPGKKIVILGGRGKGEDYGQLKVALQANARWAILIGEAAPEIANALKKNGYTDFSIVEGMEEAVKNAAERALPGDMVLLSPACTSWDMYKNYGERGDHFASLVRRRQESRHS